MHLWVKELRGFPAKHQTLGRGLGQAPPPSLRGNQPCGHLAPRPPPSDYETFNFSHCKPLSWWYCAAGVLANYDKYEKCWVKSLMESRIFTQPQSTPSQIMYYYRGKTGQFTGQEIGRSPSDQSDQSIRTNWCHALPDAMWQERHIVSAAKIHNLNPIMRTHETDTKLGTFCKTTGLYSSKCQS